MTIIARTPKKERELTGLVLSSVTSVNHTKDLMRGNKRLGDLGGKKPGKSRLIENERISNGHISHDEYVLQCHVLPLMTVFC